MSFLEDALAEVDRKMGKAVKGSEPEVGTHTVLWILETLQEYLESDNIEGAKRLLRKLKETTRRIIAGEKVELI